MANITTGVYAKRMKFIRKTLADNPEISRDELSEITMKEFDVQRYRISSLITALDHYPKRKMLPDARPASKDGYKVCVQCDDEKTLSEFPTKKRRKDKIEVYAYCKSCHNTNQKAQSIKRHFGLSMDERNSMGDACQICGFMPKTRSNAVDHDHKTMEIRGILCARCNRGITWFQDKSELFDAASDYLRNPPARKVFKDKRYANESANKRRRKRTKKKNRSLLDDK